MSKRRVLVIGLGAFRTAIVETMWRVRGLEVVALDPSETAVDRVKTRTAAAFVGDGSDSEVLADIGAAEMDAAVVIR